MKKNIKTTKDVRREEKDNYSILDTIVKIMKIVVGLATTVSLIVGIVVAPNLIMQNKINSTYNIENKNKSTELFQESNIFNIYDNLNDNSIEEKINTLIDILDTSKTDSFISYGDEFLDELEEIKNNESNQEIIDKIDSVFNEINEVYKSLSEREAKAYELIANNDINSAIEAFSELYKEEATYHNVDEVYHLLIGQWGNDYFNSTTLGRKLLLDELIRFIVSDLYWKLKDETLELLKKTANIHD